MDMQSVGRKTAADILLCNLSLSRHITSHHITSHHIWRRSPGVERWRPQVKAATHEPSARPVETGRPDGRQDGPRFSAPDLAAVWRLSIGCQCQAGLSILQYYNYSNKYCNTFQYCQRCCNTCCLFSIACGIAIPLEVKYCNTQKPHF